MGRASRQSDIAEVKKPPEELRTPPAFEPRGLSPELAEDLRRRADAVRRYGGEVRQWAEDMRSIVATILGQLSHETVPVTDRLAVQFAQLERQVERDYLPLLIRHEELRRMAEQQEPPVRAAWLGFLDPYIAVLREILDVAREARFRMFDAVRQKVPGFWEKVPGFCPADMDERDVDGLLNTRAVLVYKVLAEQEFGVPCRTEMETVGGERYPIVEIPVPAGIDRPHRVYAAKEQRMHELVEARLPDLAGRVVLRYVRNADAA